MDAPDAPPVNRLLQLLRQRPLDTPEPSHDSPNRVSLGELSLQSTLQSNTQPDTKSGTLESHDSSRQPATESDTQPVRQSNIQSVPRGSRQSARSSRQPATESDTQEVQQSSTLSATQEDISLAVTGLSKGQQRVLQFLLSNRDSVNHSRTIPIGYD